LVAAVRLRVVPDERVLDERVLPPERDDDERELDERDDEERDVPPERDEPEERELEERDDPDERDPPERDEPEPDEREPEEREPEDEERELDDPPDFLRLDDPPLPPDDSAMALLPKTKFAQDYLMLAARATSGARSQQTEPAQHHQRGLAEAAALRQEAELDGDVVDVEEAARAAHVAVAQLEQVNAVESDEAAAGGQRADVAAVRSGEAPRQARVSVVDDRGAGLLEPDIRERRAHAAGVRRERAEPLDRIGHERVLVEHVDAAAVAERLGRGRQPGGAPALCEPARPARDELAHVSSATPSAGVDASA
jgi:hypothetical protein